jgi:hypothetical protein
MNRSALESMNLASQPFRRERAQNAAYAGVCAILLCSLLVLAGLILHERAEAKYIRQTIEAQRIQLATLQREQALYSGILGKPDNADVFSISVFLNELIARRSVSWTKAFQDLQTVMPSNMRLEVIRLPQLAAPESGGVNRVQLDMVVGTDQPEAVILLLKQLERSSVFGAAAVVNRTPPTQNDPLYKYRVTVAYAQKL